MHVGGGGFHHAPSAAIPTEYLLGMMKLCLNAWVLPWLYRGDNEDQKQTSAGQHPGNRSLGHSVCLWNRILKNHTMQQEIYLLM